MNRTVMKWWGWGVEGKGGFSAERHPYLIDWIKKTLHIKQYRMTPPIDRKEIRLPTPHLNAAFIEEMKQVLRSDQMNSDEEARLCHSYGKSYRDLIRMRKGIVTRSPDMVIYPENHTEVEAILRSAAQHQVCVIPYGGGTNIVGGVEPRGNHDRMIVTLHMGSMSKLLQIDQYSHTASFETGILGPELEETLGRYGYSMGHIPDSFEFSSLGGWIASRSAGQQSDAYGKIEDMVVSMKLVSPKGTIMTKTSPACSIGPDINQLLVGSEGTLGVITEATMQVHPIPEHRDYQGVLFPSFEKGVEAIRQMVHSGNRPSMIRFLDEGDVDLAVGLRKKSSTMHSIMNYAKQLYLSKILGWKNPCLMILGFEGGEENVKQRSKYCLKMCKQMKGMILGPSVGKKWKENRFDVPYIRDHVMDYAIMVDVAETATTWSNLIPLYNKVRAAILSSMEEMGHPGWVGCHISHCYETGASLYFTFACLQKEGLEIEQYEHVKGAATAAIVRFGGSLSHHHAVGYEHRPWLAEEIGESGIKILQGIKGVLDPDSLVNPGKLMQADER